MTLSTKNTKDKILEFIKKEVSVTVTDLIVHLGITHMAIRKHLNVLEKDKLIKVKEEKQTMGRPLFRYSLTEKGERLFPKNYEGISVEFLYDIQETFGEDAVDTLFKKRELRLTSEHQNRVVQQKNSYDKILEIEKIQNEKGYMAKANKVDEETYELVEYNCPIYAIASNFKTACHCETEMFKNVLGTKNVNRICCKTDGDPHCKFLIKYNEKEAITQ